MSTALPPTAEVKTAYGIQRIVYVSHSVLIEHWTMFKGGFTPKTMHRAKCLDFYLLSGSIMIHYYSGKNEPGSTTQLLKPGVLITLEPEQWYRLEGLEDSHLILIHWLECVNLRDRFVVDSGGIYT